MCFNMWAWCRYTRGRFERTHGGFSNVSHHTHRTSWGVWRKVSSPEVLRLFFCERRMRCVFVWCSSYSSQWTGQVPFTSWGCRAHHGYGELMGLLFRAVYTGTRPGLTPAIRAGKGWRGRRELAPWCSATQLAARRHAPGQTRRALNDSYHTHRTHTTPRDNTQQHTTTHNNTRRQSQRQTERRQRKKTEKEASDVFVLFNPDLTSACDPEPATSFFFSQLVTLALISTRCLLTVFPETFLSRQRATHIQISDDFFEGP